MDFATLAQQCAPHVHISTLAAVVRHESGFNPLIIGVNEKPHRTIVPASRQDAAQQVRKLLAGGKNFDVGYGQINVTHWAPLGVTPEKILDPCVNLAYAQRVLVDCYRRAARHHGPGQHALYASLSCYNTGTLSRGFHNGYVEKVLAGARLAVPALAPPPRHPRPLKPALASTRKASPAAAATKSPPTARTDAFAAHKQDAFAATRADAFGQPSDAAIGHPVPRADAEPP